VTAYYADSSALLKVYLPEVGTHWMRQQVQSAQEVITSKISLVESFAGTARREREGYLSVADATVIRRDIAHDYSTQYVLLEVTEDVIRTACHLTKWHPLRGYDAVQLATALIANAARILSGLPPLIFLSADGRLCQEARNEGLLVDNPNLHP
jgi:hypothetical protein